MPTGHSDPHARTKEESSMPMIRSAACWPAFGIVTAVAGAAWFIADEGGFHPRSSAAAIAQADPPTSPANALTASRREERRLKGTSVKSYRTRFRLNEDPISEGGRWINGRKDGMDWYDVITRNGVAHGAVTRGDYTDPTALLKGAWGKNQHGKGRVFSRNQTEKYYQEVEIRLRSSLTARTCTGYEVFWRCLKTPKAYVEIVRWNGKVKDWTSLKKYTGAQYGVKDGDLVEATIIGNVIKGYLNGVEMISVTDDTYKKGKPGIGFNYGVGESNVDFGFTYFEVDSSND
jgi:hypothetical protein